MRSRLLVVLSATALLGWGEGGATLAAQALPSSPPESTARARFWVRPVASLVLPGAGQLLAGEDRSAVYLAAELYVLTRFIQLHREGVREADRFRTLAYEVARRGIAPVRRDTVFEYYETMQRFTASGEFDRDPGQAFVPESDSTTYNGSVWLLARRTFWANPNVPPDPTSPEYQRALQFYRARAVGPDFLWSWADAALEHQVFRETIRNSDHAFRRAQIQLGILLANHVASAVDALISSRLTAAVRRPAVLHTTLGGAPRAATLRLSIGF